MWQDKLLTVAALGFVYSLIPQIILNHQQSCVMMSWQTIIITSVGLYVFAICFFTLKLRFTAITNMFTAICWTIILIQKVIY